MIQKSVSSVKASLWAVSENLATLDKVIAATWAIKPYDFGQNQESLGSWSSTFQGLAQSLADALLAGLSPQLR